MPEEVEVEICCDVLLEAINSGGIQVVEVRPGVYCEVVPDEQGETGLAINFCPFCGQKRPYDAGSTDGAVVESAK